MKRILILLFGTIIFFSSAEAQNNMLIMEGRVMHSKILNIDVHYSVCLPSGYYKDIKTKYPVTYMLHGLGDDASSWLEYGAVNRFLQKAISDGDAIPMILIMPEGFNNYYVNDYAGKFLYQDMFVNELVPHIDSLFRTIKNKDNRALIGYSMGGFGALILHLKHPDVFGTSVPLSISIRTDEQYMTEEASGWDDQWGRLFGAPGLVGEARLTKYYYQNSPFHIIPALTKQEKEKLNIYIINGDDEQTLCRSNEELHILMHSAGLNHQYRVVNGGHSFIVWENALTNAFRFISDSFQGKVYRGDKQPLNNQNEVMDLNKKEFHVTEKAIGYENLSLKVYTPVDYYNGNRKYPVLFIEDTLSELNMNSLVRMIENNKAINEECPIIMVHIPSGNLSKLEDIYNVIKNEFRVREGYKFRSIMSLNSNGFDALKSISEMRFNALIMVDDNITTDQVNQIVTVDNMENLKRTKFFIENNDNSAFTEGNGMLHILFRENEISHEYRVRETFKNSDQFIENISESVEFAAFNFHR